MTDGDRVSHERRLRAAVLAGDEAAWREWYDGCFERVERYIRWRCGGGRDLADDVLQEAWMTAVRRVRTFDPAAGPFVSWVTGIAANVLRNHLRKCHRVGRRQRGLAGDEAAPAAPERCHRTAAALDELNPRYESALRGKYLDGRTVADLAAEWGESVKAVESVLSRAREAFREAYERLGQDDG